MYIYIAKHVESNLVYVGATSIGLEHRIADHVLKSNNGLGSKFQLALKNYGKESFEWLIVDEARTKSELAHKEQQYIIGYNSVLNGFNSDRGGGIKKVVHQYCLKTKIYLKSFNSLTAAGEEVGGDKKQISRACYSVGNVFRGFYWSFLKLPHFCGYRDFRKKRLFQYDLSDNFIAEFSSISECSVATGINKSCIAKVCRGERKTASNYIFKFK